MTIDTQGLAGQFADAVQHRGTPALLRKVSMTVGPAPMPSPPILVNPMVDGTISAGASTITIKADEARGVIKLGDQLTIDGRVYTVSADAQSRPASSMNPGFANLQVTPVTVGHANNTPVTVSWASDLACYVVISNFPRRLIDGNLIQASDLDIIMPAAGMPEPTSLDRIVVAGKEKTIVSTIPAYVMGEIIHWRIQAR